MKRLIKFRGKSVLTGEWVYSMTIGKGTIKRKFNNVYMEVSEDNWVQVVPETIGQYIGHADKTGKEVFEGDILCTNNLTDNRFDKWESWEFGYTQVYWDNECMGFRCTHWQIDIDNPNSAYDISFIEISGNLYDNPDLLGQ